MRELTELSRDIFGGRDPDTIRTQLSGSQLTAPPQPHSKPRSTHLLSSPHLPDKYPAHIPRQPRLVFAAQKTFIHPEQTNLDNSNDTTSSLRLDHKMNTVRLLGPEHACLCIMSCFC